MRRSGKELHLGDVHRFGPFGALFRLVGDLDPLRKRAVAVTRDAGEMDEQVTPAIVGRDEAEALVVAEPLDGTRCHLLPLLLLSVAPVAPWRRPTREPYQGDPAQGRQLARATSPHLSASAAAAISSGSPS